MDRNALLRCIVADTLRHWMFDMDILMDSAEAHVELDSG